MVGGGRNEEAKKLGCWPGTAPPSLQQKKSDRITIPGFLSFFFVYLALCYLSFSYLCLVIFWVPKLK